MIESKAYKAEENQRIVVIGVGNAGNRIVNRMVDQGTDKAEFIGVDTDKHSFYDSRASKFFLIGEGLIKDTDVKTNPGTGEKAAWESAGEISAAIKGAGMVFVICGMGGTGSGAAPVVAKLAKDMDILTVGVVTEPCSFEGEERLAWAREGVERLKEHVNSLILYPGDRLMEAEGGNVLPMGAFSVMEKTLLQAVKGIVDMISRPDIINLDLADVEGIMRPRGAAHIGSGEGQGKEMALDAVMMAVGRLMLEETSRSLEDPCNILIYVFGDIDLSDVNDALNYVQDLAGENSNIILGAGCTGDAAENCCEVLVLVKFTDGAVQKPGKDYSMAEQFEHEFRDFFSDIDQ